MNRYRYVSAIVILMVSLIIAAQARADCFFNGKKVPEGTRVGPLVCDNGRWVEKQ